MPLSPVPHVRGLLLAAGAGRRFGGPKALARKEAHGPTLVELAVRVLRDGGCDGVTVVVGAAADEVANALAPLLSTSDRMVAAPGAVAKWPAARTGHSGSDQHAHRDLHHDVAGDVPCEVAGEVPCEVAGNVDLVVCRDWAEGMGASLRAGLSALSAEAEVEAALVMLVDLPDVGADVVARLLSHSSSLPSSSLPSSSLPSLPPGAAGPGGVEGPVGHEGQWRAALARAAYDGVPGHPALIGRDHWEGVIGSATGDRGARDYYRAHAHDLIECGDLASGADADRPEDLASGRDSGQPEDLASPE